METLNLSVLSPERKLVEKIPVEEVTVTGSEGQIQILPGHAPIIGTLDTGVFHYREPNGHVCVGMLSQGFFEMAGNELTLLAEHLELRGEIDVERAKKAQIEAEEALNDADLDEHHFKKYQLELQRAVVRQQIAERGHE